MSEETYSDIDEENSRDTVKTIAKNLNNIRVAAISADAKHNRMTHISSLKLHTHDVMNDGHKHAIPRTGSSQFQEREEICIASFRVKHALWMVKGKIRNEPSICGLVKDIMSPPRYRINLPPLSSRASSPIGYRRR